VWDATGVDVAAANAAIERQRQEEDPYPEEGLDAPPRGQEGALPPPGQGGRPAAAPRVSVTPGNRRKGESATDITTRSVAR
jgi:hypothetical protein